MSARRVRTAQKPAWRSRTMIAGGSIAAAILALILVIGAAQTTASRQGADPNDARQVAQGRQVYAEKCASCHGANLEGQPDWKQELPEGGRTAPPHDQAGHTWRHVKS